MSARAGGTRKASRAARLAVTTKGGIRALSERQRIANPAARQSTTAMAKGVDPPHTMKAARIITSTKPGHPRSFKLNR